MCALTRRAYITALGRISPLVLLAVLLFVALSFRNSGIYPVVFADEYSYSKFSRLVSFADSPVPGYLYLAIYRISNLCGDGFLNCARTLNSLFFVLGGFFVYATARRICNRDAALIVAALSILGPINTYTCYYMPEASYFFSFWVFTWFFLGLNASSSMGQWCVAGILLGLSALVKPHVVFLFPGLCAYVLLVMRENKSSGVLSTLTRASCLILVGLAVKLLIGYLIAGSAGITLLGHRYTSIASSSLSDIEKYFELLNMSLRMLEGHALGILFMFGVPIAVGLDILLGSAPGGQRGGSGKKVAVYAFLVISSLVILVSVFTASVADLGPGETLERLHMRYYNFTFPLLLVIVASQLTFDSGADRFPRRTVIALPVGAAMAFALYTHLAPYAPNVVDSPELRGLITNSTVFYALGSMSILCLALWVYSARIGSRTFLFLVAPLAVLFSTVYASKELRHRLVPDVFDQAGVFARNYLSRQDLSKLVVVGSQRAGLYKSLFYIDNPWASFLELPPETCCEVSKLPVGTEWVLVIGDHCLCEQIGFQVMGRGFALARVSDAIMFDFRQGASPGFIAKTRGLSAPEAWGTWSVSDTVTLEFSMPLPEKFRMHLTGHAFGPNIGRKLEVHIGETVLPFTLGAAPSEVVLDVENPGRSSTIKIDVPVPTSPKELGLSSDERPLGIGLTELRIVVH